MPAPLRVLIIEDFPDDAELVVMQLRRGGYHPRWKQVTCREELEQALESDWDVVLSDYRLPNFTSVEALKLVRQIDPWLPFIVVSGTVREEDAIEMMRLGSNDYVFKDNLLRLVPAIERELRESARMRAGQQKSQLLAAIVDSTDDAVFSETLGGVITTWNPGAERLFGRSERDILGRTLHVNFATGMHDAFSDLKQRVKEYRRTQICETAVLNHLGHRIDVSVSISPIINKERALIGYSTLVRDITPQRQSECEQRRVANLLHAVADNAIDLIFVKDLDGKYLLFNEAAAAFVGRPASEVIGKDDTKIFSPEDAAMIRASDLRVIATGQPITQEEVLTGAEGKRVYLATKAPFLNEAGEIVGLVGISRDITDRKQAERALAEHRAKLADAVKIARLGYWSRDLKTGRLDWSDELFPMFGIDPQTFDHTFGAFISRIHPEDRERIRETVQRAEKTGGRFEHMYRVIVGEEIRAIREIGEVICSPAGEPLRITGNAQDMTAVWTKENALRQSESRFRAFMDNSPAPGWITDAEGRVLYVSRAYRKTIRMPEGGPVGKLAHELYPAEYADEYLKNIRHVVETWNVLETTEFAVGADGSRREFIVYKFPIPVADGPPHVGGIAIDVTQRRRAEEQLRLRDRAMQALRQGLMITDATQPDNPAVYVNRAFEQLTGYPPEEVLGRNGRFLQGANTDPEAVRQIRESIRNCHSCTVELLNYRKDGSTFWNELSISPVEDAGGKVTHFIGVQVDVTTRRRLEEQLRESQKLEAIGLLAGGIAHDFNNLLTIIIGYCELLLEELHPGDEMYESLDAIHQAGRRSAALTNQLLAFGRRQVLTPQVLELNSIVREIGSMLRRLIGEDIEFETDLDEDLLPVRADLGQIEQVLLNLAVNARDAMPTGGCLRISSRNVTPEDLASFGIVAAAEQPHVCLSISDSGEGMPPEVKSRIFEPFFTTKERGKGTGLGLAVVHGVVTQSGGHVAVESEPGHGTTFSLYLPAVDPQQESGGQSPLADSLDDLRGDETILLVEDETEVRVLARRMLESQGYVVFEAGSAAEAERVAKSAGPPLHLLITDVVMPDRGGREVAESIRETFPDVRVLFVSGYTDDRVVRYGVMQQTTNFLQKPFSSLTLARKVREVLGRPGA